MHLAALSFSLLSSLLFFVVVLTRLFCSSFACTATRCRLLASIYSFRHTSRLLLSVTAASRSLSYESRAAVLEELARCAAPSQLVSTARSLNGTARLVRFVGSDLLPSFVPARSLPQFARIDRRCSSCRLTFLPWVRKAA